MIPINAKGVLNSLMYLYIIIVNSIKNCAINKIIFHLIIKSFQFMKIMN